MNEPPTTRVRGGLSPWLIALVTLAVLGSVVYLGVTGPSLPPRATTTPQPVAVVAPPTPRPSRNTSFDPNEIVSIRADPDAGVLYQYLGTALTIKGRGTLAVLDTVGPDEYRAIYRIPVALSAPTARLEFDAVTASVSHDDLARIGEWTFPINSIANGTGAPVIVLDTRENTGIETQLNPEFNRVVTNGYHLVATTQNQGDAALMTVDLTVNPDQQFPQESYYVAAGPSSDQLAFELESFGHGGYDGQAPIPAELLGTTMPVTLLSRSLDSSAVMVGTWAIQIPRSVAEAEASGTDSTEIHEAGFDLSIGTGVLDGALYLTVVVNIQPASPAPTR